MRLHREAHCGLLRAARAGIPAAPSRLTAETGIPRQAWKAVSPRERGYDDHPTQVSDMGDSIDKASSGFCDDVVPFSHARSTAGAARRHGDSRGWTGCCCLRPLRPPFRPACWHGSRALTNMPQRSSRAAAAIADRLGGGLHQSPVDVAALLGNRPSPSIRLSSEIHPCTPTPFLRFPSRPAAAEHQRSARHDAQPFFRPCVPIIPTQLCPRAPSVRLSSMKKGGRLIRGSR